MIGEQSSPSQGAPLGGSRPAKPGVGDGAGTASGEARINPVPFPVRLTGEAISVAAMALATLALGTGLYLHAGFEPWAAAATAVAAYVCMLAVHAMMPRFFSVEAYGAERSDEFSAASGGPVARGGPGAVAKTASGGRTQHREPAPPPARQGVASYPSHQAGQMAARPQGSSTPGPGAPGLPAEGPAATRPAPGAANPGAVLKPDGRPAPAEKTAAAPNPPPPPKSMPASGATNTAPAPREADVEMIQGLIKKLADEVNAASTEPVKAKGEAEKVSERAITQSVDALKATANSMRGQDEAAALRRAEAGSGTGGAASRGEDVSETGRPPAVNQRLSALAEALALGRVEVLLDPIVDFNANRPKHFEIAVRLRDEAGNVLGTDGVGAELSGTGMLSRLDGARVENASQIAVRFAGRGREAAVFSTVSGESLTSNKFLDGVAHAYRERTSFAGQLVMTFSQDDVRGFGAREWQMLQEFARLGFRYAIADVNDLDLDFEELKAKGFEFVKLDADVFLRGLPAGNDVFVPAPDICKHLAGLGLSVIVGRIEDPEIAARIFGFGVLLGQGTLFGGAKAVKREALSGSGHAAA